EYSIVYLKDAPSSLPALGSLGQVLDRDALSALVETTPEQTSGLISTYRTARLHARGFRLAEALARGARQAEEQRAATHDPRIQALVDGVNKTRMQARVQEMQNMGSRRSEDGTGVTAQHWLEQQFQALGYTDVSTFSYNAWSDCVIAVKPGVATPEQIYVIGGHYDSYSWSGAAPGADDNASGTVGVLEAAQLMAAEQFNSTIYFIAWSGEEQGLVGSDAWCDWAWNAGLDLRGYVNLDMEGYRSGVADLDIISDAASTWMRDLVFEIAPLYVPTLPLVDGFLSGGSSDHASFWAHGWPALFLFEDSDNYSPYIHSSSDVIGTSLNDFQFMEDNIQVAIALLATMAQPFTIGIQHTPLADQPGGVDPYPIVATVVAAQPLVADSTRVWYRTDGSAWHSALLAPTGGMNTFAGFIPAQPAGSFVEYYLRARDQSGAVAVDPSGAPASSHAFDVGLDLAWSDDFELDRGWTVGAPGDNATSGLWLRADPVGTDYQPEDDHTVDPGHVCFVTGNGAVGGGNGDQDVDGGKTTLTSPIIDLSGAARAKLGYWRWYVDETRYDDDFYVYLSNDGGTNWTLLERVLDSVRPFTQAQFRDLETVLPLTGQMRLRFVAEDVSGASLVEAALDDVTIRAFFPAEVALESVAPARLALSAPRPNPGSGDVAMNLVLPTRSAVTVSLHDPSGRRVRSLLEKTLDAGVHPLNWRVTEEGGRDLPAGVYFIVARAGAETARRSWVHLR
ncbi:MAG: M20/M25/M40 family metallo-hydrolase, partial [Candidatus Eisenbacteria bacterium]|nr:M20/M25/M40 family metallo-hydrolase [Candidatus Eisenbacteria bacterium]